MRRALAALCGVMACTAGWAADPMIALGRDPGGVAVAILSDGFDTTRSDVRAMLARDGEGEAIAWDAVDGDHIPFAKDGGGTGLVFAATALGGVRVIPVRVASGDVQSVARGLAFAAQTPARMVVLSLAADQPAAADMLRAAAQRFGDVLFVAAVRGAVSWQPAGSPANVITVASATLHEAGADQTVAASDSALGAAQAVARALGCDQGELAGGTGDERKRAFLGRVRSAPLPDPPTCEDRGSSEGQPGK